MTTAILNARLIEGLDEAILFARGIEAAAKGLECLDAGMLSGVRHLIAEHADNLEGLRNAVGNDEREDVHACPVKHADIEKMIEDLPFLGKRKRPVRKDQLPRDFWKGVKSTGDNIEDQNLGYAYGKMVRPIISAERGPFLGWIVQDMIENRCPKHIAVGFFQAISEAVCALPKWERQRRPRAVEIPRASQ